LLADFHTRGIGAFFACSARPDARNSGLFTRCTVPEPGRPGLARPRLLPCGPICGAAPGVCKPYRAHVQTAGARHKRKPKTTLLLCWILRQPSPKRAKHAWNCVDPIANYHKFAVADVLRDFGNVPFVAYLSAVGLEKVPDVNHPSAGVFPGALRHGSRASSGRLEDISQMAPSCGPQRLTCIAPPKRSRLPFTGKSCGSNRNRSPLATRREGHRRSDRRSPRPAFCGEAFPARGPRADERAGRNLEGRLS